jgi:hypothetical protein
MPATGEKPGKGTCCCINCGQAVTLDDVVTFLETDHSPRHLRVVEYR